MYLNNIVPLKSGSEVTHGLSKMAPFESVRAVSYSPSNSPGNSPGRTWIRTIRLQ